MMYAVARLGLGSHGDWPRTDPSEILATVFQSMGVVTPRPGGAHEATFASLVGCQCIGDTGEGWRRVTGAMKVGVGRRTDTLQSPRPSHGGVPPDRHPGRNHPVGGFV